MLGSVLPADTINFEACSKEISKNITSFFWNINKNPLVGFGVVGTKTFIKSSPTLFLISPVFSLVAKPTAHVPFLGYSTKTTDFLSDFLFAKVSVNCPTAE